MENLGLSLFFLLLLLNSVMLLTSYTQKIKLIKVSVISSLVGFLSFIYLGHELTKKDHVLSWSVDWIHIQSTSKPLSIDASFILDQMAFKYISFVLFVSLCIQAFCLFYMGKDKRGGFFQANLNIFTATMCALVLSSNILFTFFCWELMGICSFLMIGHKFSDKLAVKSAFMAFLTTKIGDVFFLLSIALLWNGTKSFNYLEIQDLYSNHVPVLKLVPWFFLIAVTTKSAQFPFYFWLPKAMKGPTPASALIHAATMVTAGVWILFKLGMVFNDVNVRQAIILIGISSSLLGAFKAMFSFKLKELLAFSTISHLGLMVLGMGLGKGEVVIYHLFSHGFFKGALFILAGYILLSRGDFRKEVAILDAKTSPFLVIITLPLIISLAGLPFSKISETKAIILGGLSEQGAFLEIAGVLLTLFTSIYSFVFIYNLYFKGLRLSDLLKQKSMVQLPPWTLWIPVITLSILSISPVFNALFTNNMSLVATPYVMWMKGVGVITFIGSFIFRKSIMKFLNRFRDEDTPIVNLLINEFSWSTLFKRPAIILAKIDQEIIDRKLVDGTGALGLRGQYFFNWTDRVLVDGFVDGIGFFIKIFNLVLRIMQNGRIQTYLAVLALAVGIFSIYRII